MAERVVSVAVREADTVAAKEEDMVVAKGADTVVARVDTAAARVDLVASEGGEDGEGNREARPDHVLPARQSVRWAC